MILPGAGLAAYVLTFKLPGHNVAPAWRRTCLQLSFSIIKKTGKVHIKHHRMNLRRQRPRNGRRQAPWARSPVTVVHNSEAVLWRLGGGGGGEGAADQPLTRPDQRHRHKLESSTITKVQNVGDTDNRCVVADERCVLATETDDRCVVADERCVLAAETDDRCVVADDRCVVADDRCVLATETDNRCVVANERCVLATETDDRCVVADERCVLATETDNRCVVADERCVLATETDNRCVVADERCV